MVKTLNTTMIHHLGKILKMFFFILKTMITQYEKQIQQMQEKLKESEEIKEAELKKMEMKLVSSILVLEASELFENV